MNLVIQSLWHAYGHCCGQKKHSKRKNDPIVIAVSVRWKMLRNSMYISKEKSTEKAFSKEFSEFNAGNIGKHFLIILIGFIQLQWCRIFTGKNENYVLLVQLLLLNILCMCLLHYTTCKIIRIISSVTLLKTFFLWYLCSGRMSNIWKFIFRKKKFLLRQFSFFEDFSWLGFSFTKIFQ